MHSIILTLYNIKRKSTKSTMFFIEKPKFHLSETKEHVRSLIHSQSTIPLMNKASRRLFSKYRNSRPQTNDQLQDHKSRVSPPIFRITQRGGSGTQASRGSGSRHTRQRDKIGYSYESRQSFPNGTENSSDDVKETTRPLYIRQTVSAMCVTSMTARARAIAHFVEIPRKTKQHLWKCRECIIR